MPAAGPPRPDPPGEPPRHCERCGAKNPGVKYDEPLREWLCHFCWANSKPPK
jgi:hypothetical protein